MRIAETHEWNGFPLLNGLNTSSKLDLSNSLKLPDFLNPNQSITINGLSFTAKVKLNKSDLLTAFENFPSTGISSSDAQSLYDSKINNSNGIFSGSFNAGYSTSANINGEIEVTAEKKTIYSNINFSGPLNGTSSQPPVFTHYVTPGTTENLTLSEGTYNFEIINDNRWHDGSYLTALGTITKNDGSTQPFIGRYNSYMGGIIFSDGAFDFGPNDKISSSFDDYLNIGKFAPDSYISVGQKFQFNVRTENRDPITITTEPTDAFVNNNFKNTKGLNFQVGPTADQIITIEIPDFGKNGQITGSITSDKLSTSIASINGAMNVIQKVNFSLNQVAATRATMGAVMNRLQHVVDNLTNVSMNEEASRSQIEDADYASASTELARTQIMQQAATAVLAQANMDGKMVLKLLNT